MIELKAEQRAIAAHVACESSSLYFTSIINNRAEGIVWADSLNSPSFLLVWSPYQKGFQLMGKAIAKSEYKKFGFWFVRTIPELLKKQGMDYFEYGVDHAALADMMQSIFAHVKVYSSSQFFYIMNEKFHRLPIPIEYNLYKVDDSFIQRQDFDKSFLIIELNNAFGYQGMVQGGICYVAVKDRTVVARADMFFWNEQYANISVSTKEEHQNKGLATCLASNVIEDTYTRGLIPVWDCTNDNLASQKTAIKCGFKKAGEYPIYWILNVFEV